MDPLRIAPTPGTTGSPSWFQSSQDDVESRLRLFCFPYAGGGASIFRNWSRRLGPQIEVMPALLPGREGRIRLPLCTRLESIVEPLARDIVRYLDRPFAFFGHSMGSTIAFELSRRLRSEHGVEPDQLFISGRGAPQLSVNDPWLHDLPEPEFLAVVQRLNGTPREVLADAELRQIIVPLLRADFAVCDTYRYVPDVPLNCPITVLGGTQDPEVGRDKLEGWRQQTAGDFRLHVLPGDHFFINHSQSEVLDIIGNTLSRL